MPISDQDLAVISLETKLTMLDTMLFDLERAENDANTTQQQRGRIKELHIDMSRDYALLYPKYEAARQNKITMKRPSAQDFQKVSALSDQVEIYIKGNKATSDAIQISGEVLDQIRKASVKEK